MAEPPKQFNFLLKKFIVFFVLFGTMATSLVFWQVRTIITQFDFLKNDAGLYVEMSLGKETSDNYAPHRSLIPDLVKLMPNPPKYFFPEKLIKKGIYQEKNLASIKFGLFNIFFLLATAITMYHLVRNFGMPHTHGVVGALLFFSLTGVVTFGGVPMVDSAYWFFLILGVFAIQTQKSWLLVLTFIVGLWAKETVLFLILYIVLAPFPWSRRFRLLACTIPGIAFFLLGQWFGANRTGDLSHYVWVPSLLKSLILTNHIDFPKMVKLFLAFNLLWIPCVYAFFKCRPPQLLARWFYIIPIFLIFCGVLNLNFYRHLVAVSPVVIPLALLGLDSWYPLNETGLLGK